MLYRGSGRRVNTLYNKLYWGTLFLLLGLPLHTTNNLLKYVTLFNNFTIFHFVFLFLAIIQLFEVITPYSRLSSKYIISILYGCFLIIGVVVGIKAGNTNNLVLADFLYYFMTFEIMFVYNSKRVKKKTLYGLLQFCSKAMLFSCTLSLLMYFTRNFAFWGLTSFNEGRYFGGNLSLLIVTIPFTIYSYMFYTKKKFWKLLISLPIEIYCLILAQSRTAFLVIALGIVLVLGLKVLKKQTKFEVLKNVFLICMMFAFVIVFLTSDLDVVARLLGTDTANSFSTLSYRVYLYQGYWKLIFKKLFGYGFGSQMYFLDSSLTIAKQTETLAVDSAYITYGYKVGFSFLAFLIYITFFVISNVIKKGRQSKSDLYILAAFTVCAFCFSTMLITAQVVHTYTINAFFAVLVSMSQYDVRSNKDKVIKCNVKLN